MNLIVEILLLILNIIRIFLVTILKWFIPARYKSVKDEVCLITGAGSGIGRIMALEFAKRGAVMVLWDVNVKGNEDTAELIREAGGKAFAEKCDVSNREEVYKMARRARVVAGDVTILVNNAGVVYGKDFRDMKDAEIEKTMQVNSMAHIWTVRAFLPDMMDKNHGHIVTIASVMGLFASAGMPSYVASKHAAVGFGQAIELDLQKHKKDGVKTTIVCPFHINTGMFSGIGTRFTDLLPPLEPDECVRAIMHAVLTNRHMVAMPRSMYLAYNAVTWLPHEAAALLNKFLGSTDAMTKFVPTRDYQREAVKSS